MKKTVILFLILQFIFLQLFAINEDPNVLQNTSCIVIKQNFERSGSHCPPSLGFTECTFYDDENSVDNGISNFKFKANTVIYCEFKDGSFFVDDKKVTKLHLKTEVEDMANDDNQEFDFYLTLNARSQSKGASDPCQNKWNDLHGSYRNSYNIQTTVLCDVPIPVEVLNPVNAKSLNIDKKETLKLQLGNYYEKGQTRIRYQINGENEWHTCSKDVKIEKVRLLS